MDRKFSSFPKTLKKILLIYVEHPQHTLSAKDPAMQKIMQIKNKLFIIYFLFYVPNFSYA